MKIIKRNGTEVDFDLSKIENAIRKEFGFDCCPISLLIRSKRAYDLMGDRK